MKKSLIGSIILLLVFLFGTSSAIELTVFGPQKYVRTKGKPDVYTDIFQSRQGLAKIQIINGNEDGSHRISSARIILNGTRIFGPRDFNQQVGELSADIQLEQENTLKVELDSNSKPPHKPGHEDKGHKHSGFFKGFFLKIFDLPSRFWSYCGFGNHPNSPGYDGPYLTIMIFQDVPAPSASITIEPETIISGQSANLNWNCSEAESCSIDPGIGNVDLSGGMEVSPAETTTYTLTASSIAGSATSRATVTVHYPPTAQITAEPQSIALGQSAMLSWSTTHADTVRIEPGIGDVDLAGSITVSPSTSTTYTITATGLGGTATSDAVLAVTYPVPTVTIQAEPEAIERGEAIILSWTSSNADTCAIEPDIGTVPANGSLEVIPSENTTYMITATGPGGTASTSVSVTVTEPAGAPTVHMEPAEITIALGETVTLNWSSTGADKAHIDNGVGTVPASGSITIEPPEHTTFFTLTVSGATGSASAMATVHVAGSPAMQSEGTFGHMYNDLIPADATVPAYDEIRFAVVTGIVNDINAAPIEGVTVMIHDHLEYGTVKTDVDGRFAIPAEGGGQLIVAYQKEGLISAQRKVEVPWNDYAIVETLQMIAEDTAATAITFDGDANHVMVHRSTLISDQDGSRSATLVFTGDNMAYLKDENGNQIHQLPTIKVTASEYVTPESMPAVLPPTSAYTYCAELSVDGAERVFFAKPVVMWVDNFLGLDVGEIVPVGYYDRDRGLWVPSEDGIIVQLLDLDGDGKVDAIDATGDGQPDDLDDDGTFSSEVIGLDDPSRYVPGTSYWRSDIAHFTPIDCNFPWGPPEDAIAPNPDGEPKIDEECDDCDSSTNSYVESRARIYNEDIPIPGTDLNLHYASNRVDGYHMKVDIPVSGSSVPKSLRRIHVSLFVGGRSFSQTLPAAANQKTDFLWDKKDWRGNYIQGAITATVSIGFEYSLRITYMSDSNVNKSFARLGARRSDYLGREVMVSYKRFIINLNLSQFKDVVADGWTISNHHLLPNPKASILTKGDGEFIKAIDDSYKYSYLDLTGFINTYAGSSEYGSSGDGGPAIEAQLGDPYAVEFDAKGDLYILDNAFQNIRKVDSNGIISTVAGNGSDGFSGDGGLATEAMLNWPEDIAIDSEGNLYIADSSNHRIRKVDQKGIITTIAGIGAPPEPPGPLPSFAASAEAYDVSAAATDSQDIGDEGPAVDAQLDFPNSVAVDSNGNIYISDYGHNRIRKIDSSGLISTVTGIETAGFSGDGGLAMYAELDGPVDVFADREGNLFIVDGHNYRIRKIDPSGIITTVVEYTDWVSSVTVDEAGNLYLVERDRHLVKKVHPNGSVNVIAGTGERPGPLEDIGDGGLSKKAPLDYPNDIAIDPKGNIYIAQKKRVREVTEPRLYLTFYGINGTVYTDENGLGYVMSDIGQHLKTIDLQTGVTLQTFEYNRLKRLESITDRFSQQTMIVRPDYLVPSEIISPDGIVTTLTVDQDNHLTRLTFPDGSYYSFEYTPDGLMSAEVDPAGNRFDHVFDEAGRITDVLDEDGGHWRYSQSVDNSGTKVSQVQSGEGNIISYADKTDRGKSNSSLITAATGDQTHFVHTYETDSAQKSLPCGTELTFDYAFDPQYKFRFMNRSVERLPSSLTRTIQYENEYEDTNQDETPDIATQKTILNGNAITTDSNDIVQGIRTITSPEKRITTINYDRDKLLTQSIQIPNLYETYFEYDGKGRLVSVRSDSRQLALSYNGQGFIESITDPEDHTTNYGYDALGRVTSIHRPDGSDLEFAYDPNGNMTLLTNPAGVPHGFSFNKVNLPSGYQTPISGSYSYVYDKDRNLIQTNFPSGKQINKIYESTQLIQIQTPEGDIDLIYGCGGNLASIAKDGEIIDYTYDGKLLTDETRSGTFNQNLHYSYNNDFKVIAMGYAGGTETFSYDLDGLLTGSGDFIIIRNAGNGLTESVSGKGLSINRSFNGYGEFDGQILTVNSRPIVQWALTRDNAGRIITKTETAGGQTHSYEYGYDAMGRLLSVTRDGTIVEEYEYELTGTRIFESNVLRGIAGRNMDYSDEEQLLSAGEAIYSYNLDGFLSAKTEPGQVTTYDYSSRGELLQVQLPDGRTVSYDHDPMGRRIAKRIDDVIVEKYLWQGMTKLLAVYDGSDTLIQRFEYADSLMPVSMTMNGSTYFLACDQEGSLRVVVDSNGNVVKRIDYDSFGNILEDTNSAFQIPFGFAGGLHDRDTGLVRFGFRDYDPDTGRWTAKDPIRFGGGDTDLYGYVSYDPVNLIDPEGKFFNFAAAGVGAVVGGVINAAYAYSKGESALNGFAVGALAGALSGLTLNPYLVGAIVGAANSAGNIVAGIDNPCSPTQAIAIGALTGAIVGGIGGAGGEAMAPKAPEIGAAAGEAAGASLANAAQGFINFWQDF